MTAAKKSNAIIQQETRHKTQATLATWQLCDIIKQQSSISKMSSDRGVDDSSNKDTEDTLSRTEFPNSTLEMSNNQGRDSSTIGATGVTRIGFVKEHRSGVNVYDHYQEIKLLGYASQVFFPLLFSEATPLLNSFFYLIESVHFLKLCSLRREEATRFFPIALQTLRNSPPFHFCSHAHAWKWMRNIMFLIKNLNQCNYLL